MGSAMGTNEMTGGGEGTRGAALRCLKWSCWPIGAVLSGHAGPFSLSQCGAGKTPRKTSVQGGTPGDDPCRGVRCRQRYEAYVSNQLSCGPSLWRNRRSRISRDIPHPSSGRPVRFCFSTLTWSTAFSILSSKPLGEKLQVQWSWFAERFV